MSSNPLSKQCFLNGSTSNEKSSSIDAFEKKLEIEQPWL
jgi:hypothetical protein